MYNEDRINLIVHTEKNLLEWCLKFFAKRLARFVFFFSEYHAQNVLI